MDDILLSEHCCIADQDPFFDRDGSLLFQFEQRGEGFEVFGVKGSISLIFDYKHSLIKEESSLALFIKAHVVNGVGGGRPFLRKDAVGQHLLAELLPTYHYKYTYPHQLTTIHPPISPSLTLLWEFKSTLFLLIIFNNAPATRALA